MPIRLCDIEHCRLKNVPVCTPANARTNSLDALEVRGESETPLFFRTFAGAQSRGLALRNVCIGESLPPKSYFQHRRRSRTDKPSQPGAGRVSDEALLARIHAIHAEVRHEYGWPRVLKALLARGIPVGKDRVQRLMRAYGIKVRGKRKFVVMTDSRHSLLIAPNLLAEPADQDLQPRGAGLGLEQRHYLHRNRRGLAVPGCGD